MTGSADRSGPDPLGSAPLGPDQLAADAIAPDPLATNAITPDRFGPDRVRFDLAWLLVTSLVIAVQLAVFPMPLGAEVLGLLLGLTGSLMAVALALVHRLHRVVNFAQGGIGGAPAVLVFGLVGLSGVNYFLGLLTGVVGVVVLTVLVEVLVVRRFSEAPRLVLTVVTIGLSQLLIVISLVIPDLWPGTVLANASVNFPWRVSVDVAPVVFHADAVVGAVLALLSLAGVAIWLVRTESGVAMRATAENRPRAASLGIPVHHVQLLAWVVAGLLSFLSVFTTATVLGLPLGDTFGLQALVSALAAVAMAGFRSLPLTAVSAVAVGLLQEGVAWNQPTNPTLVFAVTAAVVLVAMAARTGISGRLATVGRWARVGRGGALGRVATAGQVATASRVATAGRLASARSQVPGAWSLVGAGRALPPAVAADRSVRAAGLGAGASLLAGAATLPLWVGPGQLLDLVVLAALALVGLSLVVVTGWGGMVSLGQMSFAAVGAAVSAVALVDWHFDLSLALLLAGAASASVAVVVGSTTLRLDGTFAAVTTLAFGLAVSGYLLDRAQFSWIPTAAIPSATLFGRIHIASERSLFELALALVVLALVGARGIRRSATGRRWLATAGNPAASSAFGVRPVAAKLTAFAVSGFVAGLGGTVILLANQQYLESPFVVTQSLAVFTATVVGGISWCSGALVGAALIEGSAVFLPPSWQLLPTSLGVVLVLMLLPGGVVPGVWRSVQRTLVGRLHVTESRSDVGGSTTVPAA